MLHSRNATTAAFCTNEVAFEVLWDWTLEHAAMISRGPAAYPRRQPVIENAFEKPLMTIVSFLIFS